MVEFHEKREGLTGWGGKSDNGITRKRKKWKQLK